jgi:hypothetical protein
VEQDEPSRLRLHDFGRVTEHVERLGLTCSDWTSSASNLAAQIGHSDGMGRNQSTTPPANSWNSAHANQSCADTAPRGGAGRFYCFAR